ncbi:MAG: DUF6456 domain-containing protein [Alphaproteobacteria bacterium]|nr:DUF6456 domain-containing protein [Alphaproteobacteria bacterium]
MKRVPTSQPVILKRQPTRAQRAKIAASCLSSATERVEPTEHRFKHDTIIAEPTSVETASGRADAQGWRVVTQTPLDRYRTMGYVDERQWQGGDRLRATFEASCFERLAQTAPDRVGGGGPVDPADIPVRAIAARRSYLAALQALPNRVAAVVVHVACHRGSASDWALARKLPKQDGMALLRLGLDILYDHYTARNRRKHGETE